MDSALRVVRGGGGGQSESARLSAVSVINSWIRKQLRVTFNIVMDDLTPEAFFAQPGAQVEKRGGAGDV